VSSCPPGITPSAALIPQGTPSRGRGSSTTAADGGPTRPGASAPPPQFSPLPHPLAADLEQLCHRVALQAGLELRTLQVLTHRIPMTVQVMVQRADGDDVSLDQCAALSSPLGEALEAADLLDAPYVLEVSSPGIGEDLKSDRDFASFRGFEVDLVRRGADGSEALSKGHLLGRDDQMVQLNDHGRILRIPRDEVLSVRLANAPPDP